MSPSTRRNLFFFVAVLLVIAFGIIFPRVLSFTEMAAREIRFMWWLFLLIGLGLYLAFSGRKRD